MSKNKNGVVVWRGPSKETGDPIMIVLTGLENPSANRKTGDILQTWIMRSDVSPLEAIKTGGDEAICGDCPMRGKNGKDRGCYVTVLFGPNAVYKTASIDNYGGELKRMNRFALRLGSYGDPYYIPYEVIEGLAKSVKKHSSYTHAWRKNDAAPYARVSMASVESLADKEKANSQGWRTFRVTSDLTSKTADEVICPASNEAGKKLTCAECGLCNGNWNGKKKNVVIAAHGSKIATLPAALKQVS